MTTYSIDTDRTRLDLDFIHRFLSSEAYWSLGIPRDLVERAISSSLCFGAYDGDVQVGFARVVTDYATFGYVADVFVVVDHRGQGIGRLLMSAITSHPHLQRLRRWMLVTRDAHELYRGFGFHELENPSRCMERVRKNAYAPPEP
jgi:N-acetylglutamate synthase-like GNAT family acetyltransferase